MVGIEDHVLIRGLRGGACLAGKGNGQIENDTIVIIVSGTTLLFVSIIIIINGIIVLCNVEETRG